MTIQEVEQLAKDKLSPKRYTHEKNVVAAAVKLAKHYGESPEKAALAGWLHDIVKEESPDTMLQRLEQDAIIEKSTKKRPVPVWHGPCAAVFAKHQLQLEDEGILSAISCHTTGKPAMQKLDKILFVADRISSERDFDGVEELRSLAFEDLDAAVLTILRKSIGYVKQHGRPLDEESLAALEYLEQEKAGDTY